MEFKQVIFNQPLRNWNYKLTSPEPGIACYDDGKLQFIICACYGDVYKVNESDIVKKYEKWIDLGDPILGVG